MPQSEESLQQAHDSLDMETDSEGDPSNAAHNTYQSSSQYGQQLPPSSFSRGTSRLLSSPTSKERRDRLRREEEDEGEEMETRNDEGGGDAGEEDETVLQARPTRWRNKRIVADTEGEDDEGEEKEER